MCRAIVVGLVFLTFGSAVPAAEQAIDRHDLGQRLVQLERAWDAQPDPAARPRGGPVLKQVVPQLFADKTGDASATFDRARFLLLSAAEPTPAERWAASLLVHTTSRLFDMADGPLTVRVLSAYPAGDPPAGAVLRL